MEILSHFRVSFHREIAKKRRHADAQTYAAFVGSAALHFTTKATPVWALVSGALAEKRDCVLNTNYWLMKQAHIVWMASIVNIGLGVIIPDFNFLAKSISFVALEAPIYAYTHRTADIIIGLSMCGFAFGIYRASHNWFSSAALSSFLFGISMISAGIWTLETPLHLLYNLSIFMIILPIAFSLEFKNVIGSKSFENICVGVTVLHVFMFWLIYAGFIPQEYNGLIQRMWAIPTMGWFGIAAHTLLSCLFSANVSMQSTANASAALKR